METNKYKKYSIRDVYEFARSGDETNLKIALNRKSNTKKWHINNESYWRREEGSNAIISASRNGHINCIKILVEKGIDVNSKDKEGNTSLHTVIKDCYNVEKILDTVKVLIELGANIECKNINGITPLHTCALCGANECFRLLIELGADISSKDNRQLTPLFHAASEGHFECVSESFDPTIDYETDDGYTPLMAAVKQGSLDAVYFLLWAGSDINAFTITKGYTPLMIACKYNQYEIVAALLHNQAKFDCRAVDGYSALMIACKIGHERVVETLLQWGAIEDIDYTMPNGVNALYVAIKYNHKLIVLILLAYNVLITESIFNLSNNGFEKIIEEEILRRVERLDFGYHFRFSYNFAHHFHYRSFFVPQKNDNHIIKIIKSNRVNFDSFISNNIEYQHYRNHIYTRCFPDGDYRIIKNPVIGWINAEKLINYCYYNEILFNLHLNIAKVNSGIQKDAIVLSSNVIKNLSIYSNKTYILMSILSIKLYEYIIKD